VPLPYIVVRSAQWARLSPFAVKLLLELLGQYCGNNNGDLTTAWTVLRLRGWKSKQSLYKAIDELESGAWIQRTRQGGRHTATLWAITFFALDEDTPWVKAKMDIVAGDFRRGAWAQQRIDPPVAQINGVSGGPPVVPRKSKLGRPSYQSTAPEASIAPPVVPVAGVFAPSLPRPSYTSIELPSQGDVPGDPSPPLASTMNRAAVALQKPSGRQLPAQSLDADSPEAFSSRRELGRGHEPDRARRRWEHRQDSRARCAAKLVAR
jgi:hypothetical protein